MAGESTAHGFLGIYWPPFLLPESPVLKLLLMLLKRGKLAFTFFYFAYWLQCTFKCASYPFVLSGTLLSSVDRPD